MTVPPAPRPREIGFSRVIERLIVQRCQALHRDNQRLLHRIHRVKKLTDLYKKEIRFLVDRLDMHGDPFRSVEPAQDKESSARSKTSERPKAAPKKPAAKKKRPSTSDKAKSTGNLDSRRKF